MEILKTAREITMRVRYFPYSKCLPAPSLLTLQHFSLGSRPPCILASLPDLCLEGCLNIVKMRKKSPNFKLLVAEHIVPRDTGGKEGRKSREARQGFFIKWKLILK